MSQGNFSSTALLGSVIDGRFEILEKLGEGGMGAIYRARQLSVDRMVALKVLLHDQRGDPISVERFRHEAYLASRIRHPNAIVIHDFGHTPDGMLYIAMEFLSGETVKERLLREGPQSLDDGLHIMTQCLRCIAEAHKLGMVHRDLKPDNVSLIGVENDRNYVKVLDFGIAKLYHAEEGDEGYQGGLTVAGKIFGTPNYMSPEQIRGKPVNQQSDLYSLAVIFYEVICGRMPFVASTPVEVMMMHLRDTPPPLRELRADVPPDLEAVVMRGLEKDPHQRYRTADEFLEALDNFRYSSGYFGIQGRYTPSRGSDAPGLSGANRALSGPISAPHVAMQTPIPSTPRPSPSGGVDARRSGPHIPRSISAPHMRPPTPTPLGPPPNRGTDESQDEDETVVGVVVSAIDNLSANAFLGSATGDNSYPATSPGTSIDTGNSAGTGPPPEEVTMIELDDDEFEEVDSSGILELSADDDTGRNPVPASADVGAEAVLGPRRPTPFSDPEPAMPAGPPQVKRTLLGIPGSAGIGGRIVPMPSTTPTPAVAPTPAPVVTEPSAQRSGKRTLLGHPTAPPVVERPAAPDFSRGANAGPSESIQIDFGADEQDPVALARPEPVIARPSPFGAVIHDNAVEPAIAVSVSAAGRPRAGKTNHRRGRLLIALAILVVIVGAGVAAAIIFEPFADGPNEPLTVSPVSHKLVIESEPGGVEIFDRGLFVGSSPMEFEGVPSESPHDMSILVGKKNLTAKFPARRGTHWLFIHVKDADHGELGAATVVTKPDGATVKADGMVIGRTPVTYLASIGADVAFEVELAGHPKTERTAKLAKGGVEVEFSLQ